MRVDANKKAVREEAKKQLLEHLREGSQVFVIVRKHSRTGYSKSISLYTFTTRTDAGYHASKENPKAQPLTLTHWVARLMGYTVHEADGGRGVITTDDYPQEFVAHLSQNLFGIEKANSLDCEVL
jgi:hypothetical protein